MIQRGSGRSAIHCREAEPGVVIHLDLRPTGAINAPVLTSVWCWIAKDVLLPGLSVSSSEKAGLRGGQTALAKALALELEYQ